MQMECSNQIWAISRPEWMSQPLPSQRWWIRCKQPQATNPNRRKMYRTVKTQNHCKPAASLGSVETLVICSPDYLRCCTGRTKASLGGLCGAYLGDYTLISARNMRMAGIETTAQRLEEQLASEISKKSLDEAFTLARAFSHYLNLMGIAETHHSVRKGRNVPFLSKSCDDIFNKLIQSGVPPEQLYNSVCKQEVEIVLTAHPSILHK